MRLPSSGGSSSSSNQSGMAQAVIPDTSARLSARVQAFRIRIDTALLWQRIEHQAGPVPQLLGNAGILAQLSIAHAGSFGIAPRQG